MNSFQDFLKWEIASKDTIDVKRIYVDLADDLVAGILLSQIIYWYLPSKVNKKTKLRVRKQGELWLAKGRDDWWEECRITAKQFDRACQILIDKGLLRKKIFKFNANPMVHLQLNEEKLLEGVNSLLTFGEEGNSPLGNNDIDLSVISLTESTTENTTKNTNNNSKGFSDLVFSSVELVSNIEVEGESEIPTVKKELEVERENNSSLSVEVESEIQVEEERKVDTVKKELERENNSPLPEKVEVEKENKSLTAEEIKRIEKIKRKWNFPSAKEFREYRENAEVREKHQETVLLDYFCDAYKKFSTNGEYIVNEGDGELILRTYLNVGGKGFYEETVEKLFNKWERISTDFQVDEITIQFLYDNAYNIWLKYPK